MGKTFCDYGTPEDTHTLDNARDEIAESYGGLIAGRIAGYPENFGAHRDYQNATQIAYALVTELGGGELMCRTYGHATMQNREKSERTKMAIEDDVGHILKEEESRAERLLASIGKENILKLAKILAKERVLLKEEFDALLAELGIPLEPARVF